MGTVSIEIPGPGTYQVQCDPKLPALADGGTSGDVLAGKQFYNDQNAPVTGTMPNNPPQAVELSGGNSYTIPRGFHDGTGKVTGVGTVLPDLPSPAGAGDILAGKQAVSGDGTRLTGIMPNNPPEDVEVSGGESYQIPEGYHTGTGKVTGKGTVLPELTDPATAADILIRKEVIDQSGQELAGTMPNNGAVSAELAAGGSYTIPAGYHNGQGKVISTAVPLPSLSDPAVSGDIISGKEAIDGTGAKVTGTMPAVAAATPTISVSPDGLITATAQQAEGYVEAATETAAQQLETQGAQTIVPGTADQTVPAGKFLTGAQTIQGDAGLLPENIKKGVSLFGVDGSYEPGLPADVRTITLTADPPEGGTVSGGGIATDGMICNVKAEADLSNFRFGSWQEDGDVITFEPEHSFEVFSNRNLVAKFIELSDSLGTTWNSMDLPASARWYPPAYGIGKFVTCAVNSRNAAYSEDGKTWNLVTLPYISKDYDLIFGNGKFIIIDGSTSNSITYIFYSEDGVTWNRVNANKNIGSVYPVFFQKANLFLATMYSSYSVYYSSDGINWTERINAAPSSMTGIPIIIQNDKVFLLPGTSTNKISYSDDGINYTALTMPRTQAWYDILYVEFIRKYVAITRGSNVAAYSEDGTVWTEVTIPKTANWTAICASADKIVVVATDTGDVACSTDGQNWELGSLPSTGPWVAPLYVHGKFVSVQSNANRATYSEDGLNWELINLPVSGFWRKIIFEANKDIMLCVPYGGSQGIYSI